MRKILIAILFLILLIGCEGSGDIPDLMKKLNSSNAHDRSQAAMSLGRIGAPHATKAVPKLISLLKDSNAGVQSAAAYALRKIDSPDARVALEHASQ